MNMKLTLTILALLSLTTTYAKNWSLAPIVGDNTNKWRSAPNWTWTHGNPMEDNGAQWNIAIQNRDNPTLTDTYKNMEKGLAYNYNFCWRGTEGGNNPGFKYLKNSLCTYIDKGPKKGPSAAILFKTPKTGTYQVTISGKIHLQNKTAGYVIVTLYTLKNNRTEANEIKTYKLNSQGGFGKYPDTLSFDEKIKLTAEEELAVRVQTCNPGPSQAGHSTLSLKEFKISTIGD